MPVGRGVVEVWPRCFEADVHKLKDYPYICANLNVAPLGSTAAFTAASSALSPMNSTTTPLKEPGEACLNAFSSTFAVVAEFGPPAATMLPGNTVAATTVSIWSWTRPSVSSADEALAGWPAVPALPAEVPAAATSTGTSGTK